MNEKLYLDILKIKEDIKKTDEYKLFLGANKDLENNDDAKRLSYKKDVAIMELEDAINHFGKNSKEALEKEKVLAKIAYDLNHLEVVEKYNEAYKNLKTYYDKINEECFSIFGENND